MMPEADDTLTVRAARAQYFAANGFGEEDYAARWVKLQAGPIPLYFPNTPARVRAVRFHDVHHVLTRYDTTWLGEAEIAAWEIASGCAAHYAAWILNLYALAIGLAINPRAVARAFVRGRHSANLYRATFDERVLAVRVGVERQRLGLDRAPATVGLPDYLLFGVWAVLGVAMLLGSAAIILALVVTLIRLLAS